MFQTLDGLAIAQSAENEWKGIWMKDRRNTGKDESMSEMNQEAKADDLHIVHCVDCKHKYFKDFSAFCPYRFGPLRPYGYCERGESEDKDG